MRTKTLLFALMALVLVMPLVSPASAADVVIIKVVDGKNKNPLANAEVYRSGVPFNTYLGKTTMTQWYVTDRGVVNGINGYVRYDASWGFYKRGSIFVDVGYNPFWGSKEFTIEVW